MIPSVAWILFNSSVERVEHRRKSGHKIAVSKTIMSSSWGKALAIADVLSRCLTHIVSKLVPCLLESIKISHLKEDKPGSIHLRPTRSVRSNKRLIRFTAEDCDWKVGLQKEEG